MSKLLRAVLIGAYGALFIQFLRTFTMDRYERLIEIKYEFSTQNQMKKLIREWKHNKNVTAQLFEYKRPERLHTDLIYILKYTTQFYSDKHMVFSKGQEPFIEDHCEYLNCYFTADKFLLHDIRHFDAIVFGIDDDEPPPMVRAAHQKYIFLSLESSTYNPICNQVFNQYYNLTWTFKLKSDIKFTYLLIYDLNYELVGPNINITWVNPMKPTTRDVIQKLKKKTKMAAWFVSNCDARNNRMNVSKEIEKHLNKFGYGLDIYGQCGTMVCTADQHGDCLERVQKNYYFYFAFENSYDEDYVTEKLLHALMHYTVPVVYGGADYSRFMPPGSYIDARKLKPYAVASLMIEAISGNKQKYYDFFKWHNHYIYKNSDDVSDKCALCKVLNEKPGTAVIKNMRKWWNPDYKNSCEISPMELPVKDLERDIREKKRKLNRNKRTGSDMSAETDERKTTNHFAL